MLKLVQVFFLKGGDPSMFQGIGTAEVVVIGVVLLILFGGKKLPELARGMGDALKEFRKAAAETV